MPVRLGREVDGKETGIAGGLREAVSVDDRNLKTLFEAPGELGRERAGSADDMTEAREILRRTIGMFVQEKLEQSRDHARNMDPFGGDAGKEFVGMEFLI